MAPCASARHDFAAACVGKDLRSSFPSRLLHTLARYVGLHPHLPPPWERQAFA
jgi:hypothetical protein